MTGKPPAAQSLAAAAHDLYELGRLDLARQCCAVALELAPDDPRGHEVMAAILDTLGRGLEGLVHWRRAEAGQSTPRRQLNRALAELRAGDLPRGFALYEARTEVKGWISQATDESIAAVSAARLRPGEPVRGRRIAVLTEQGLGDVLAMARFVPMLAAQGAEVTLVCTSALRPLLATLPGVARLLAPPSDQPMARINLRALNVDAFCPLMSLPLLLGIEAAAPVAPYLGADAAAVAAWRGRFAAAGRPGLRPVGLVWQANPASRSGAQRSIPDDLLARLAVPGVQWVNLQAGDQARGLSAHLPDAFDALAEPRPLDDVAAAVAAVDLMVTVDTMAAHLAGALGQPAWVALPADPAWYWGLDGVERRWYAGTRLFRQSEPGEWRGVVDALAGALRQRAGAG